MNSPPEAVKISQIEEQVEERRDQEDGAREGEQPEQRRRHVAKPLRQGQAALEQRHAEAQDLHHALRPAAALADEGGEGGRLQAGDQRLVDIDAVPAAGMQLQRGLAILGDADAAEAAGVVERLAAEHRGRAAEEGGVPLVQPALDDAVEHLVLRRHALEGPEVALQRVGIEEEVRGLDEEQPRVLGEDSRRSPSGSRAPARGRRRTRRSARRWNAPCRC